MDYQVIESSVTLGTSHCSTNQARTNPYEREESIQFTLHQGLRLCSPADYSGFPPSFHLFPSLAEEVRLGCQDHGQLLSFVGDCSCKVSLYILLVQELFPASNNI